MAAHEHLQGEQLSMFLPAKNLMDYPPLDDHDTKPETFHKAKDLLAFKRDRIKNDYLHSGSGNKFKESVAREGVHNPVQLHRTLRGNRGWGVGDGHHRVIAAYDTNPDMEVPVKYVQ